MAFNPEKDSFTIHETGDLLMAQTERRLELIEGAQAMYVGRLNFGKGKIDAGGVSEQLYMEHLNYAASNCLVYLPDYRQQFGGCMDGRGNVMSDDGNTEVLPRPKVIGGPSWFAWAVASVGNFTILHDVDDPLEQFEIINRQLSESNFRLGMHVQCGAARGSQPVNENLAESYDNINKFLGLRARQLVNQYGDQLLPSILDGAKKTALNLSRVKNFTEQNMHEVIKSIDGPAAILHLATDHDHETHGHEEEALNFIDVENGIVYKDKFNSDLDAQAFWQNQRYARSLIAPLARSHIEFRKGAIIGDQLALSGATVLGKDQHVGQITDLLDVA